MRLQADADFERRSRIPSVMGSDKDKGSTPMSSNNRNGDKRGEKMADANDPAA